MSEGRLSAEGTKNGLYVLVDKIEIEQFVMKTMSDVFKSNEGIGMLRAIQVKSSNNVTNNCRWHS